MPSKIRIFSQWIEIRLHPRHTASLGLRLLSWPWKISSSYIWPVILVLFAVFLVKCARQRQDSKRFMLSYAWQYQNSQAYERNHYSRTFLAIALVKQKISNRLKCWSSLFADILLHYSALFRFFTRWNVLVFKCDDGTRSAVPVATLKRKLQSLRCLRTTLRLLP